MTGVVLVEVRLFDDCLPIASYFLAYSSNSAASDDTGRRPPGDDRQADDTWGKAISIGRVAWGRTMLFLEI